MTQLFFFYQTHEKLHKEEHTFINIIRISTNPFDMRIQFLFCDSLFLDNIRINKYCKYRVIISLLPKVFFHFRQK